MTDDFEYCLKIADRDYSLVADETIFKADLLRFSSLASFQLFDHAVQAEKEALVANFEVLIQSLRFAEQALEIYKAECQHSHRTHPVYEPNKYGMALCLFTLGYIYQHFSDALCDTRMLSEPAYENYMMTEKKQCMNKAVYYFKLAIEEFKAVNHLMGAFLCKFNQWKIMKSLVYLI